MRFHVRWEQHGFFLYAISNLVFKAQLMLLSSHSYPNKSVSSGPYNNTNYCYDFYHSYNGWMSATKQMSLYRKD